MRKGRRTLPNERKTDFVTQRGAGVFGFAARVERQVPSLSATLPGQKQLSGRYPAMAFWPVAHQLAGLTTTPVSIPSCLLRRELQTLSLN